MAEMIDRKEDWVCICLVVRKSSQSSLLLLLLLKQAGRQAAEANNPGWLA